MPNPTTSHVGIASDARNRQSARKPATVTATREHFRREALILHRGIGEVQIGTDPRWSLRLTGLSHAQQLWFRNQHPGKRVVPPPATDPAAAQIAGLIDVLREARIIVPRPGSARRERPGAWHVTAPAKGHGDLPVLSSLRADDDGRRTLERRASAVVGISGLGRIGAGIVVHLATAGIGSVLLDDDDPVVPSDTGFGVYHREDIDSPRSAALARILDRVAPGVAVRSNSEPELVITTHHYVADLGHLAELVSHGIPHLPVVSGEADVQIGPLVLPGRTPCMGCLEHHLTDADPAWRTVRGQLANMAHPPAQETTLTAMAVALSAGQALMAIDGMTPHTAEQRIGISAPDALPWLYDVCAHPQCGCMTPVALANGSATGSGSRMD